MSLRRFALLLLMMSGLFALFLTPLAAPRHALALSNDGISITSQSNTMNFPSSITFTVNAADAGSTFVSASFVVNLRSNQGLVSNHIDIANAQRALHLTFTQSTTGTNFVPPGSVVYYYWRFSDTAGNTYLEPMQQFTTVDTRFQWQHLTQGFLQVNWYNRQQDFGQTVLTDASTDIQHISGNLGGGLIHPINLWVYQNSTDFQGSLPPGTYEWVGGIAFPTLHEASIVVSDPSDYTLIRDMPHELTHLVFHQLIASGEGGGNYAPTWFDEGMAVYNQLYHEPDMKTRFNQALSSQSLLRLSTISFSFPSDADQAYLAYAQSWNLVGYMFSTFGLTKMHQLIKDMNDPQNDFGQDLTLALGLDEDHLENQWRLHLNQSAILSPDQVTPTPQVAQKSGTKVSSSGDDRSWVLIALGGLLVVVSLIGFITLFAGVNRRRRRTGPDTGPLNALPANYQDPALYMRASMYAQPIAQASPGIQTQDYPNQPPGFPTQEYNGYQQQPGAPPRRQYPQE